MGENEPYTVAGWQTQMRHHRNEIVPTGAQAMQPNHRGIGGSVGFQYFTLKQDPALPYTKFGTGYHDCRCLRLYPLMWSL
jgi:hypothetical protein